MHEVVSTDSKKTLLSRYSSFCFGSVPP